MPNRGPAGDEESSGPARLPGGRHGLPPEYIARHQRERLISGLAEAVGRRGYADTSIADITQAAGVSRRTFYANFANKEDCFLATFDVVLEHLRDSMDKAVAESEDWPHQARDVLAAILRFMASEPDLARLCLVESMAAGAAVAARYRDALAYLAERLRGGRAERRAEHPLPDATEQVLIGGVASFIVSRINEGETEHLLDSLPDLVKLLLTPYLGGEPAERLAREPL